MRLKSDSIDSKKAALDAKLVKVEKSNQYDIREINGKRTQLRNLTLLEKAIQKSKLVLQQGQKALNSAQNDKLTSSIRQVDKFKGNDFFIYVRPPPLI